MEQFDKRKKDVLGKEDKSSKSIWDEKIIPLCQKLNLSENYYTTSSCSGKSTIMEDKVGKDGTYYIWTSHSLLDFEEFFKIISNLGFKKNLKFKSESPILFVVSRDIDSAKILLKKAILSGFKQSGIIFTNKLIGVEIRSTEKLEFPLSSNKKMIFQECFIEEVVKNTNLRRKIGWEKIKLLEKEIE